MSGLAEVDRRILRHLPTWVQEARERLDHIRAAVASLGDETVSEAERVAVAPVLEEMVSNLASLEARTITWRNPR